jgi:type IV conjugative transfer system protein TraE
MNSSVLIDNITVIKKQRNSVLVLSSIMLLANLLLSLKIFSQDQKVILVPGIKQEMVISKSGVSKSYIEEMTHLLISTLLDLSPNDIEHKRELLFKYIVNEQKDVVSTFVKYFAKQTKDYKKFNLSTYYTIKDIEIDLDDLEVITHGVLTSYYGREGTQTKEQTYKLKFIWNGHSLRLQSFESLVLDGHEDDEDEPF